MDELAEILEQVGVLQWLKERFPGLSDDELIARVDRDFIGMMGNLMNVQA